MKRKSPFNDCVKVLDATVKVKLKLEKENKALKAKTKKLQKRIDAFNSALSYERDANRLKTDRIEVLKDENCKLLTDRQIFRDDLITELKFQLNCSNTEYYSPTVIISRIMNTISKAQPFTVVLK